LLLFNSLLGYVEGIQKDLTTEHTEDAENLKGIALTDKPASENFALYLSIVENRWRNLLSSISFSESTG